MHQHEVNDIATLEVDIGKLNILIRAVKGFDPPQEVADPPESSAEPLGGVDSNPP